MGPLKLTPMGFQTISAVTLASAQSLTVPAGANVAVISVTGSGAGVSWRDDGTAPTASVGNIVLATASNPFEYYGNLSAIQFILSAASPVLNVSYYKIAG